MSLLLAASKTPLPLMLNTPGILRVGSTDERKNAPQVSLAYID